MERDSDAQLVARHSADADPAAFAELVDRYRTRVFSLAISILGPGFAQEAEDVTQDVFIRVHRALAAFRGDAAFSSWIYRIAFNQAVNAKARARHRLPHVSDQHLSTMASHGANPQEQLDTVRRNEMLETCIVELPEVYQSALRLYYWLGVSVSDIAERLGAPENTIKSYLHRARRLLAVMLKERGVTDV